MSSSPRASIDRQRTPSLPQENTCSSPSELFSARTMANREDKLSRVNKFKLLLQAELQRIEEEERALLQSENGLNAGAMPPMSLLAPLSSGSANNSTLPGDNSALPEVVHDPSFSNETQDAGGRIHKRRLPTKNADSQLHVTTEVGETVSQNQQASSGISNSPTGDTRSDGQREMPPAEGGTEIVRKLADRKLPKTSINGYRNMCSLKTRNQEAVQGASITKHTPENTTVESAKPELSRRPAPAIRNDEIAINNSPAIISGKSTCETAAQSDAMAHLTGSLAPGTNPAGESVTSEIRTIQVLIGNHTVAFENVESSEDAVHRQSETDSSAKVVNCCSAAGKGRQMDRVQSEERQTGDPPSRAESAVVTYDMELKIGTVEVKFGQQMKLIDVWQQVPVSCVQSYSYIPELDRRWAFRTNRLRKQWIAVKPVGEDNAMDFTGKYPVYRYNGKAYGIRFDGEARIMMLNEKRYVVPMGMARAINIEGRRSLLAFGGPGHEVIINDQYFHVPFGGEERRIVLNFKNELSMTVSLPGERPPVLIMGEIKSKADPIYVWKFPNDDSLPWLASSSDWRKDDVSESRPGCSGRSAPRTSSVSCHTSAVSNAASNQGKQSGSYLERRRSSALSAAAAEQSALARHSEQSDTEVKDESVSGQSNIYRPARESRFQGQNTGADFRPLPRTDRDGSRSSTSPPSKRRKLSDANSNHGSSPS